MLEVKMGKKNANAFQHYKSARKQLDAAKQKALAAARDAFWAGCQELFKSHPELHSFGWQEDSDGEPSMSIPDINGLDGGELEFEADDKVFESQLQEAVAEFLGWFDEDDLRELFKEKTEVAIDRGSLSTPCENHWEVLRKFHDYFHAQTQLSQAKDWVHRTTEAAFTEGCRCVFMKDRNLSRLTWYIPDMEEEAGFWFGENNTELQEHSCAVNIPFEELDYHQECKCGGSFYDFGELGEMLVSDIRGTFGEGELTVRREGATLSIS